MQTEEGNVSFVMSRSNFGDVQGSANGYSNARRQVGVVGCDDGAAFSGPFGTAPTFLDGEEDLGAEPDGVDDVDDVWFLWGWLLRGEVRGREGEGVTYEFTDGA
jgi:hypothetical protein